MSKPIGKREARRLAFANAAALIEAEDLESLFGQLDMFEDDETLSRLEDAQRKVVAHLRRQLKEEA
jgi:hypothetical protein